MASVAKGSAKKARRQPGQAKKAVPKRARTPDKVSGGSGSGDVGSQVSGTAGNSMLSGTP